MRTLRPSMKAVMAATIVASMTTHSLAQDAGVPGFRITQSTNGWETGDAGPPESPVSCGISTNMRGPLQLLMLYVRETGAFLVMVEDERWSLGPGERISLEMRVGNVFLAQTITLESDVSARMHLPRATATQVVDEMRDATRISLRRVAEYGMRWPVGDISLDGYNLSTVARDAPGAGTVAEEFARCLQRADFFTQPRPASVQ